MENKQFFKIMDFEREQSLNELSVKQLQEIIYLGYQARHILIDKKSVL